MIPLAISAGQGSEMWQSLGVSIIGGMTFSTIITLILIPALYSIMAGFDCTQKTQEASCGAVEQQRNKYVIYETSL